MASYLQQLLHARDPLFSIGIKKLEQATGNKGVDVKLIGDIHQKAYAVLRALSLDPKNTTNKELWLALHGQYDASILKQTAYVGLVTVDGVISFNENDVRRNKNRGFADRTADAMRQALIGELAKRYRDTGRQTEAHIKSLLDESGITALNLDDKQKGDGK